MAKIDLTSPAQLGDLLRRHGFYTKKRFGQNFLVDRNVLNKIVDALDLCENDCVLEIGAGAGTLTQALAEKGVKVVAVEIDCDLLNILSEVLFDYKNVEIVNADILRLDLASFLFEHFGDRPVKVVGNLPYYITSPIITQVFEVGSQVERVVLMVQKEVGDRLKAPTRTKDYGSMSIYIQYHSVPEFIAPVPPTVFFPPPDVSSAIIRLIPRTEPPVDVPSEKLFFDVVHCAFGRRRKTLLNSLSDCPPLSLTKEQVSEVLQKADIDYMRRAETLTLEDFATVTRVVASLDKGE
ncbi:MAG: 16S rRNA (adenine(1518)-N(6)/adenine(1519)-N(6))-dimethyltransferase RsmA [Armatimonadota bacterium]